jgi:hypothetical protein
LKDYHHVLNELGLKLDVLGTPTAAIQGQQESCRAQKHKHQA